MRLGLAVGWAYGQAIEHARSRLKLSHPGDVATGLRMLQRGRIELLASNEHNTEPVLQAMGLAQQMLVLQAPIAVQAGHFAYPRNEQAEELRLSFDLGLESPHNSGALTELGRFWGVKVPD